MTTRAVLHLLAISIFTFQVSLAQQVAGTSAPLRYDTGTISNQRYTNECFGFSFAIPSGWEWQKEQGDTDTTRIGTHMPDGSMWLFSLNRHPGSPPFTRIVFVAAGGGHYPGTARDFVTRAVQSIMARDPSKYELGHAVFDVEYGRHHFYRSDYKQTLTNGGTLFIGYVYTEFRGWLLGEVLMASSAAELDESAETLKNISFEKDEPNPQCVVGDNSSTGRTVGVIGSVISSAAPSGTKPSRVRVSQGVSERLLVTKVDAEYPEQARKTGVQGSVVMEVLVDEKGSVENISVIFGDPQLVPAAVAAVKNWKYKPYLLNGDPVKMVTTVTLPFQLPK